MTIHFENAWMKALVYALAGIFLFETGLSAYRFVQTSLISPGEWLTSLAAAIALFGVLWYGQRRQQSTQRDQILNVAEQLAHDIRSPLTTFRLILSGPTDLDESQRQLLLRASHRIEQMASELLDKTRTQLE